MRNDISIQSAIQRSQNCFANFGCVFQNVNVPNPQHRIFRRSHEFVSTAIAGVIRVLAAINFDDQAYFSTSKIGEVGSEWELPNEFVTTQPAVLQLIP
jgi:hypothetical protein